MGKIKFCWYGKEGGGAVAHIRGKWLEPSGEGVNEPDYDAYLTLCGDIFSTRPQGGRMGDLEDALKDGAGVCSKCSQRYGSINRV